MLSGDWVDGKPAPKAVPLVQVRKNTDNETYRVEVTRIVVNHEGRREGISKKFGLYYTEKTAQAAADFLWSAVCDSHKAGMQDG